VGKMTNDMKKILPEFQAFLLERNLAPEKNIPFLAYWVGRFISFGRKHDIPTEAYKETAVMEFLDMLRSDDKIRDWQSRQADDAIKLYDFHLLGDNAGAISGALERVVN